MKKSKNENCQHRMMKGGQLNREVYIERNTKAKGGKKANEITSHLKPLSVAKALCSFSTDKK